MQSTPDEQIDSGKSDFSGDSYDLQLAMLVSHLADQVVRGQDLDLELICVQHPQFVSDLRGLWGTIVVAHGAASDTSATQATGKILDAGLELPSEFGEYTLLEEIGRGGMGIVYLAERHSDQTRVAIKMILGGQQATPEQRRRFKAEAEAITRLDHPHVVPVYETGEWNKHSYFCMKWIEGQSLSQRLAAGPIPSREAARLAAQISHAIHHAHQNGILHRDLKPSNVLLDKNGDAFVVDFGLARQEATDQLSLTRSGAVLGTPSYMSPEQAAGARTQVGALSDVYSLGAILYHMITGHPPFLAPSPVETVMMVIEQDPVAPHALNQHVDRSLEMIALRSLQKPQDLRYKSAGALAADLEAFLNNEPVSARVGRFGQIVGNVFRETHHAVVLENWGLLWIWHSLVLLVASVVTEIFFWNHVTNRLHYWLMWTVGLGTWAIVFWGLRRRMGPVTFVERQIAHLWAASMVCVLLLFPLEYLMKLPVLSLAPLLGALAGLVFLVKAGMLSGSFYFASVVMFATSILMALFPSVSMLLFGVAAGGCFFVSGLKYYRRRNQVKSSPPIQARGASK